MKPDEAAAAAAAVPVPAEEPAAEAPEADERKRASRRLLSSCQAVPGFLTEKFKMRDDVVVSHVEHRSNVLPRFQVRLPGDEKYEGKHSCSASYNPAVDKEQLDEAIDKAMEKLTKDTPYNLRLMLYGYYNQAINGDVQGERPTYFEQKDRAKYDAWAKCKGMDYDSAVAKCPAESGLMALARGDRPVIEDMTSAQAYLLGRHPSTRLVFVWPPSISVLAVGHMMCFMRRRHVDPRGDSSRWFVKEFESHLMQLCYNIQVFSVIEQPANSVFFTFPGVEVPAILFLSWGAGSEFFAVAVQWQVSLVLVLVIGDQSLGRRSVDASEVAMDQQENAA
ncbi:Acyl-CoA-binding protein [Symbiodinium microadriaticum]|uniref:Acyl-CoA-binding protein n=1 Tax=Symbiodinium microadriaticum TaxID=2951 RepID=A0A1Q9E265_SYMMI|nr:Acyl-CoA-binding protein [Symbiodinium microadriaticum]